MAGPETPELAEAAVMGGADLVEIGFPFSDPLADGPVIRRAAERALAQGMRTGRCLECLADVRSRMSVPLVAMTYASILEAFGYERFVSEVRLAGATSVIVADLPVDALPDLRRVQLVAPTTPRERIRMAAERTEGWLYLVTVTGSTGVRDALSSRLRGLVERTREVTDVPLLAGFGISTKEQAAAAAAMADGVVVGTRAIQVAEETGPRGLERFVAQLRRAVDDQDGDDLRNTRTSRALSG
jgi:tryptophan synthase alpha chain